MANEETAEVLRQAATIMELGGFLVGDRGTPSNPLGAHCALGAIDTVRHMQAGHIKPYWDFDDPAKDALANMVIDVIGEGIVDTYNGDCEVTRKSNVVAIIAGWNNMIAAKKPNPAKHVACYMRAAAQMLEEDTK